MGVATATFVAVDVFVAIAGFSFTKFFSEFFWLFDEPPILNDGFKNFGAELEVVIIDLLLVSELLLDDAVASICGFLFSSSTSIISSLATRFVPALLWNLTFL